MSDPTPTAAPVEIVDEPKQKLVVLVRDNGLEASSASQLLTTFEPLLLQAEEWARRVARIKVTDASQTAEMKLARESRLALKELRVNAEKARKRLKEDSLRRGKAIDGAYNIIEFIIAPLETELQAQEDFAKNKELARKATIKKVRLEEITPHLQNPATELVGLVIEDLSDETYKQLLELKQMNHNARLNEALRLHEERIAREKSEAVERERIRIENERLKHEAAEREVALQAERARVDRERAEAVAAAAQKQKELDEVNRQERLREQALREVERQKEAAERQRISDEKAALQRQLDETAAGERQRQREAETARVAELNRLLKLREAEDFEARKAAAAPDREKLRAFAATVRNLPVPHLSTTGDAPEKIHYALTEAAAFIDDLANNL